MIGIEFAAYDRPIMPLSNDPILATSGTPGFVRRLACIVYELCLLFGVTFLSSYLALSLLQWRWPLQEPRQSLFQAYLLAVLGIYFTYFWKNGGQTLAMKTWRIRVVTQEGNALTWPRAWLRFALLWWGLIPGATVLITAPHHSRWAVSIFLACSLFSLLWSRLDKNHQFLHDRLAGTRLINV